MREESKNRELHRLLRKEKGSVIVFTRSKDGATRVWRSLHSRGFYDATYIHSDRLQSHREQALAEFKAGKYRILIATDVAGRGIHVDGVAHVVNYDLPMEPEDYIHRIGRTGRAEAEGKATSFVTSRDRALVSRIQKILGREIPAEFLDGASASSPPSSHRGGGGHGHTRAQASRPSSQPKAEGPSGEGGGHGHTRAQASRPSSQPKAEGPSGEGGARKRRGRRGGRGRRGRSGGGGSAPGAPSG